MEMPPHCTVSARPGALDLSRLLFLSVLILFVHGFHPWAEDGGLYVAGVEYLLHPALFPLDRAFVTTPLRYSLFAPAVAGAVRISHASLPSVLLAVYFGSTLLMLLAALRLARQCFRNAPTAQWTGVALLGAWWTLPVAGTSLLLMDPYVTARSLSTPLTLLAISEALAVNRPHGVKPACVPMRTWSSLPQPLLRCVALLGLTAAFHPLMAIFATGFVLVLVLLRTSPTIGWLTGWFALLTLGVFGFATVLQRLAPPEGPAVVAAVVSRYYWFLSQWQWFEWCGLVGPLLLLSALPLWWFRAPSAGVRSSCMCLLCFACVLSGLLALAVSAAFAREHLAVHAVARLQPLRMFLPVYALLPLLLGGTLGGSLQRAADRHGSAQWRFAARVFPFVVVTGLAGVMFMVQRATFPKSPQIEWPGKPNPNPWVGAFVWIRENTAPDTLVALDARYINTPGEDAQTFRAIAQRSALPDFSKDGGEAANFPELALDWQRSSTATADLSRSSDAERTLHLMHFHVQWLVLHAAAPTTLACPYRNGTVKVCRVASQTQ